MQRILFFLLIFSSHGGYSQNSPFNYLPKPDLLYQIIHYENYSIAYSEIHEQAYWVAYELTKNEVDSDAFSRSDDFRADPNVYAGSAALVDYRGSGYHRGHLAPAGDFGFSNTAMSESFYMTNMSPQQPGFNRGIWRNLESLVRDWAIENESLYIITGGILTDSLKTIGVNDVAVPNYYYKIILDYTVPGIKAIAFLMKNTRSSAPVQNFVVSIDNVEIHTGIDFFPDLGDDLESQLESNISLSEWAWKTDIIDSALAIDNDIKNEPVQCKGIAKSTGKRCKIRSSMLNGLYQCAKLKLCWFKGLSNKSISFI